MFFVSIDPISKKITDLKLINYIASKKNSSFWGWAARVVVVLSVLRAVGETFVNFMQ